MDPSDPSGNTVYVGGASGGIWKTTDFLTTSPNGPTWVPLTNFGPSAAVNIASITIFPRNDNPNHSVIIAATGGDSSGQEASDAPGVGFLISTNGGVTWNLDDSTDNVSSVNTANEIGDTSNILPIDSAARNREFVGTTAYQVTVDPELTPNGQVIIYAALSGTNGGIWRSQNTGQTWTQVLAGNATSVVLDQNSGLPLDPNTGSNPSTGGTRAVPPTRATTRSSIAGIAGAQGVFMSTNQGQSWNLMAGGIGNPLIFDGDQRQERQPGQLEPTPNGARGQDRPGRPRLDQQLRGERDLRGLALRGRRHLERRLRWPVRHQGLRRELDPDPTGQPAPARPTTTRPSRPRNTTDPHTRSPTIIQATLISP